MTPQQRAAALRLADADWIERLRIAGLTLIGLSEHDQHCGVFGLDDDGKHCACTCGLDGAIATITQAGKIAAEPVQEPVAWHTEDHLTDRSATTYSKDVADRWQSKGWPVTPLYAAPQQRKPLTEEKIMDLPTGINDGTLLFLLRFARAVEQAHGIGCKP